MHHIQLRSMEAVIVGALLNPLLPFILGVLLERHKLRQGIKKDITFIKDELPMIAAAIEQHQSVDVKSEEVRRTLIEQLRELAHDMELCIGLFVHARARKRLGVQRLKKLKFPFRARRDPMGSQTQFARALQALKERSKEVKARAEVNTATGSQSSPSLPREPEEPVLRLMADTVGMDAALDHVLGYLHPPVEEKKHRLMCIVGPAGVGKSLLAHRAYNRLIDSVPLFSPHICVRAADMAEGDLFRAILRGIGIDDTARFNRDNLCRHLLRKRYLIVIDDLQNQQQWDYIKSCFPVLDCRVGSRVIVTTTSQSVADACSSPNGYVYKMTSLNKVDSTNLFIREASLEENPEAVKDFSAGLRRKCDGLPLALVSIARFVREKGGLDSCEDICRELGSYMDKERTLARMKWALESQFNNLDGPVLKACLLYFSTFDCAKQIMRDSTVRRWISEGFVEPYPRRNSLLNEQYSNWETLIDRNIIKPTAVGYNGKVKKCQPSGMMLEYISYKSMVQKFVAFHDQIPPPKHTRWLSLHNCTGVFSDLGESHPRTLTVSGPAGETVLSFPNSELMQVLDLEQCTDLEDRHVDKICDLLLLRYLSLGAQISEVPRNIENLEWLETLDLRNTQITIIPKEVILIPHLRHLLGRFQLLEDDHRQNESKLKEFMQNKSKLETLAGFVTGRNLGFPQLMHLMRHLRKVKIICNSDAHPTNLIDLKAAIGKFISDATGMTSPGNRSLSIDFRECSTNFLQDIIDSLGNAHGSLHSLKISGLQEQLSRTISSVRNISGMMELCLSSTTLSWEAVVQESLIHFRVLRYLKLAADEIQGDNVIINPEDLKSLKRLCLQVTRRLPQITIQQGALKYLDSLHLISNNVDGLSGIETTHLSGLKEVALSSRCTTATVNAWRDAAEHHPNRPNVLLIEDP